MKEIADKGDPGLRAVINDSGSNGRFEVYDNAATDVRFEVHTDGRLTVPGAIERDSSTPLRLTNLYSNVGTLVEFRNDSSSTRKLRIDVQTGPARVLRLVCVAANYWLATQVVGTWTVS